MVTSREEEILEEIIQMLFTGNLNINYTLFFINFSQFGDELRIDLTYKPYQWYVRSCLGVCWLCESYKLYFLSCYYYARWRLATTCLSITHPWSYYSVTLCQPMEISLVSHVIVLACVWVHVRAYASEQNDANINDISLDANASFTYLKTFKTAQILVKL
jgi:hypothetical protein